MEDKQLTILDQKIVPLYLLQPHPRNYKKHPEEQLRKLRAALLRFGQTKAIVVQEDNSFGRDGCYTILAGHGVFEALKSLALQTPEALIAIAPNTWTSADATAYLVADNMLCVDAETNELMLAELLEEQRALEQDLASVGYSEEQYDALIKRLGDEQLEAAAPTELPPEGDSEPFLTILIQCTDVPQLNSVHELLTENGYGGLCTVR